jgi:hypothetical protein
MSKIHSILFAVFLINCSSISLNNSSYSFNDDLNESDIKRHIKYLSSDELEGRFPGTKGSELAIDYIASNFKNYKLAPFQDNSFLQFFDFSNLEDEKSRVANVIGLIPGNKNKDEFIVIGAHFDHLGYGGAHSGSLEIGSKEIHNGADDNASGVAGILELAHKLSLNRNLLNRSIVFVAFNAEEQGIFGSKYFINNSQISKDKIITMINLDMIGRLRNLSLNVSGTGTSPFFNQILDKTSSSHMLNLNKNPEGFGPSDHSSFYSNDIPVLSFFTGGHQDYHKPSDDWDKINFPGQKKVLSMIYDIVLLIDSKNIKPTFTEAGPKSSPVTSRVRMNVTFGFMPSYTRTGKGLGVDGVRSEGPAGIAGMKKGDVIIKINKINVKDIYGYMDILQKLKPGESSTVTLLRENKEITLNVNH